MQMPSSSPESLTTAAPSKESKERVVVDREREAERDLLTGHLPHPAAWTLCIALLATLFAIPIWQFAVEWKRQPGTLPQPLQIVYILHPRRDHLLPQQEELAGFEKAMDENSVLTEAVLPPVQLFLSASLGVGNQQVVARPGGRLFYAQDYHYLLDGPFFADQARKKAILAQLIDLNKQFQDRSIDFIVVPVPPATVTYPDAIAGSRLLAVDQPGRAAMQNASWSEFKEDLKLAGVDVIDLTEPLANVRRSGGVPWMMQNSHWMPSGMEAAADVIADTLRSRGTLPSNPADPANSLVGKTRVQTTRVTVGNDLCNLLKFSPTQTQFPPANLSVRRVEIASPDGTYHPLSANQPDADVLIIGDSLSDMFDDDKDPSHPERFGGGLPQHVALRLGRKVDRLTDPTHQTELLPYAADQLRQHPERLRAKRVVIYEFNARHLNQTPDRWPLVSIGTPAASKQN